MITKPSGYSNRFAFLFCFVSLSLIAFASLVPATLAQLPAPPPDGGYLGDNTAEGDKALFNVHISTGNLIGFGNTALGFQALFDDKSGSFNTAVGLYALQHDLAGDKNTALGWCALYRAQGKFNIGIGEHAGGNVASGDYNIDIGNQGGSMPNTPVTENNTIRIGDSHQSRTFVAGIRNTTSLSNTLPVVIDSNGQLGVGNNTGGTLGGGENLNGNGATQHNTAAVGVQALVSLLPSSAGLNNTATGWQALNKNTDGNNNTATGSFALNANTTLPNPNGGFDSGGGNTATGCLSLASNKTGYDNTATGSEALSNNIIGAENVANGSQALFYSTGDNNTAIGSYALMSTTGGYNIALGFNAGVNLKTGNSNIDIGNTGFVATANESHTIRIGTKQSAQNIGLGEQNATFIAGIWNLNVANSSPVYIDPNGQLSAPGSSNRFKKDILAMGEGSNLIFALNPVTFHYKGDNTNMPQFGLVAEEVEKADKDLIIRDADGKPYGVRYDAVNAMLLNEFLKEHKKVQQLETALAAVNKRLAEQDAKIEKVNARVESKRPTAELASDQ
ncbi:MAG TPA: tail fiber domain-containing protein [Chthoniobacterales bacterium]|nr:tail fiber domain-containing protein [Chthoniobacterales bacterium]